MVAECASCGSHTLVSKSVSDTTKSFSHRTDANTQEPLDNDIQNRTLGWVEVSRVSKLGRVTLFRHEMFGLKSCDIKYIEPSFQSFYRTCFYDRYQAKALIKTGHSIIVGLFVQVSKPSEIATLLLGKIRKSAIDDQNSRF